MVVKPKPKGKQRPESIQYDQRCGRCKRKFRNVEAFCVECNDLNEESNLELEDLVKGYK
tara:strand:- start:65 stop:241 length:177 start_codon:yes stop_codon:yes gene_type:complete